MHSSGLAEFEYFIGDALRVFFLGKVPCPVDNDTLIAIVFGFDKPTTHWTLLGNNVFIVEGLDLRAVAPGDYELLCLPLKIKDSDGGPARVVLRTLND